MKILPMTAIVRLKRAKMSDNDRRWACRSGGLLEQGPERFDLPPRRHPHSLALDLLCVFLRRREVAHDAVGVSSDVPLAQTGFGFRRGSRSVDNLAQSEVQHFGIGDESRQVQRLRELVDVLEDLRACEADRVRTERERYARGSKRECAHLVKLAQVPHDDVAVGLEDSEREEEVEVGAEVAMGRRRAPR